MGKAHEVEVLSFTGSVLRLEIDGQAHEFDLAKHSDRLAKVSQAERENVEISPGGYGLHWPDLDEDLSIDGLLGTTHTSPVAEAEA
ncbi:MAG: DUF2442 domain-containing protein [Phycisphaerae bacterium]